MPEIEPVSSDVTQSQADPVRDPWKEFFSRINEPHSRRTFMGRAIATGVAASGAGAVLNACGSTTTETTIPNTKEKIRLGDEMEVSLDKFGIQYTPDLHLSYITLPQENIRRFFLTGNGGITYMLEGHASDDLPSLVHKAPAGNLPEVWGPDKFPNGKYAYSGLASVLQTDTTNPHHLIGFTHNEEHAGSNGAGTFTASISQLESFDGGKTWQPPGEEPIIKGDDPMLPGTDVSGAGQPCAIIKDGSVYIYYIDWARKNVHHKDQIYLARAQIGNNGKLDSFQFYKGTRFELGENNLVPAITPPDVKSSYTALPSISYNTKLGKYCAVTETDIGFDTTTSSDGIHWASEQLFDQFDTPHSQLASGGTFVSYPTLLSFKEASDGTTDASGYLLYAKGTPGSPHNMAARPFTIS